MQLFISVFLIGCFLLNTVSPVLAATNCSSSYASRDPFCAQWEDPQWVTERANYYKKHKAASDQREAAMIASNQAVAYVQQLVRRKNLRKAEAIGSAYTLLGRVLELPVVHECISKKTGDRVPCSPEKAAQKEISKQMGQKNSSDSDGAIIIETNSTDVDFVFGSGKGDPELEDIIRRLVAMDKEELERAILFMAISGSADPKKPSYVPPVVLNAAFLLYAQKISPQEYGRIEKYLETEKWFAKSAGVEEKHISNVRDAANTALFGFAKQNPKAVEKKFSLTDQQYNTSKVAFMPLPIMVFSLSDAPAALNALEQTADFTKFTGSAATEASSEQVAGAVARSNVVRGSVQQVVNQQVISVGATRSVAVASAPSAGAASIGVGFLLFVTLEIADAYQTIYEAKSLAAFVQAKWEFWHQVVTPVAGAEQRVYGEERITPIKEDDIFQSALLIWGAFPMSLLGRRYSSQDDKGQQAMCEYHASQATDWNLKKLDQYINSGDSLSAAQKEHFIFNCLGNTYCPNAVRDQKAFFNKCNNILLKNVTLTDAACTRELNQLLAVNEVASSFFARDTREKLFTRALFVGGKWIPEAEIGIRYNEVVASLPNIFVQEMRDMVENLLTGSDTNVSLGDNRNLRRGYHERNTKYRWDQQQRKFVKDDMASNFFQHFHYEETLTYPQNNPYICNHSIFYQP